MIDLRTEETQRTKVAEKTYFKKLSAIEKRFKVIERVDLYDQKKSTNICLFLDIIIPRKLKVLEFDKYNDMQCLTTHL
jgi:hypothetical protein